MTQSAFGFQKATPDEIAGTMALTVALHGKTTRPVHVGHTGVLRIARPLYLDDSGQVTYIIINPGGAYFGEKYDHIVDVQPGANLLLASQGATRIYRTPNEPAEQWMKFTLGAGSRLEYMPEQTIAYKDADYRQFTSITAAPDAQGFFGEIVTPGWDPEGTRFTYAGMHLRMDVRSSEEPGLVLVDNVRVQPSKIGKSIDSLGFFEGHSHMGTALVIGPHTEGEYVEKVREVVEDAGLPRAGVTAGKRHGISWVMVRALANSTDALTGMIVSVNELDRSLTTGQSRLHLRRY